MFVQFGGASNAWSHGVVSVTTVSRPKEAVCRNDAAPSASPRTCASVSGCGPQVTGIRTVRSWPSIADAADGPVRAAAATRASTSRRTP